jgi:hypothetical protein
VAAKLGGVIVVAGSRRRAPSIVLVVFIAIALAMQGQASTTRAGLL